MSITKTKNGTFRVRSKYPQDVQLTLGLSNPYYDKVFKTKKEAKSAELDFKNKVQRIQNGAPASIFELGGEMLFKDFYEQVFLPAYESGLTSNFKGIPSTVTIERTQGLFRNHLLPIFGQFTLNYLNSNKRFVSQRMMTKAQEFSEVKVIISYLNQLFDLAEEYDYIEFNRLTKLLRKIKPIKQIKLREAKDDADKYLSEENLKAWFDAIEEDLNNGFITYQDYTLFWTTFFLSDRKSESYALRWRHVDLEQNVIHLERALDKNGVEKSTKGNKKTDIVIPIRLKSILTTWKTEQKQLLQELGADQTPNQFLFTYSDYKGNTNKPVYNMYLNRRMKCIEERHPDLAHATPHKLRHTSATLAKMNGMSLEAISEGLTHSGTAVTKTYVNNNNIIQLTPADLTYQKIIGGD